ncbi:hypothetical protein CLV62_101516 [Dysgonomonas alginatilytica]|uniref:Uncharacterized protein n=1 Tax=Dysgonomonas alginatilytica TaxID=1605892 RepID=A0A2V3PU59_9BACT|nr:hypothetical protein [Dysgonomonas alginatilytica]PXV69247.1 hypothetical protein CLV62_101516 [Dysgonomonas alginatilytica]
MATGKTNSIRMKKQTLYIIYTLIGFISGFIIGRQASQSEESIKYIKGETIEKVVEIPTPYKVEIPSKPIYLYKQQDTVFNTITAKVDTNAILNDWILKRSYKKELFDNQYGTLAIDASIQYNQLQSLKYNFTPVQKEISIRKERVWMPYGSMSYSTLNYIGIGGGIFYHDVGLGAKYVTDLDKKGFEFELKYKF